jgi:hypothetical protein
VLLGQVQLNNQNPRMPLKPQDISLGQSCEHDLKPNRRSRGAEKNGSSDLLPHLGVILTP